MDDQAERPHNMNALEQLRAENARLLADGGDWVRRIRWITTTPEPQPVRDD